MKANRLKWTPAVIMALTMTLEACSNEETVNDPLAGGPVAAQVTAGISGTQARVSVINGQSAEFTSGDVIHVVADGTATYDYTLQDGGSWSAGSSPYYFQDRNSVSFHAWYADPALTLTADAISIDTKTQTNSSNGWNQWDILVTPTVTTSVENPVINFKGNNAFSHIMTQLAFIFKAGNATINDWFTADNYDGPGDATLQ